MNGNVQVTFDKKINGYIIRMPDFVSINSIEEWVHEFEHILKSLPLTQRITMLIDANKHEFESTQCLKLLREFFTTNVVIQSNVVKVAFVQPKNYREPQAVSEIEGYFESTEEAYKWLKE